MISASGVHLFRDASLSNVYRRPSSGFRPTWRPAVSSFLSPEKSFAMTFTRKRMDRCPLLLCGRALPYARTHRYLGVVIDRNPSLSPEIRLCGRISAVSQVLGYLAGSRWGSTCGSMLLFHKAYVDGLIRYSLPVLQRASSTSKMKLDAERRSSLRTCLILPRGSSST